MKIYPGSRADLQDLHEWMSGLSGVEVQVVAKPEEPNAQGTVWDFLAILCGAGGPAVAAVRALHLWIESRITTLDVVVGDSRFTVRTADAALVLPQVAKTITDSLEAREESRADGS
ncbi:effector-associated constant component EACC1 [Micromonospora chersina]|uniref:effector-associated constant component EACC1 n=1 Tax=Micromonospora chersina TaxID=47854 RepID=UPI00368FB817